MHSCETFANGVLGALGSYQGVGAIENNHRIVPGLYPGWDEEHCAVTMTHTATPEDLITLEGKVTGQPRWLTLNLDLGSGTFEAGEVIGLVADIAGAGAYSLELFIRTSAEDGNIDTVLAERLPVSTTPRVVNVLHTVGPDDGVVASDRFHTLAIRLPQFDFRLEMRAMRLFVLSARHGLRVRPMTLATSPG